MRPSPWREEILLLPEGGDQQSEGVLEGGGGHWAWLYKKNGRREQEDAAFIGVDKTTERLVFSILDGIGGREGGAEFAKRGAECAKEEWNYAARLASAYQEWLNPETVNTNIARILQREDLTGGATIISGWILGGEVHLNRIGDPHVVHSRLGFNPHHNLYVENRAFLDINTIIQNILSWDIPEEGKNEKINRLLSALPPSDYIKNQIQVLRERGENPYALYNYLESRPTTMIGTSADLHLEPGDSEPGDRILIGSDGVSGKKPEVLEQLQSQPDPQQFTDWLADFLENKRGADNATGLTFFSNSEELR